MKKIILAAAILALAGPAIAAVTITATGDGSGLITISYVADGSRVRAFALDITVDNDAIISDVNNLSSDYYVHPGSVVIADDGSVSGSIVCDAGEYADTLDGEGTSGITIEQGSLYVGEANAPAASGDLFSFVVDADCTITLAVNHIRAGVVMEDPEEDPGLTLVGFDYECPTCIPCLGDFTGISDGMELNMSTFQLEFTGNFDAPNGQVDTIDLAAIINLIVALGDIAYEVPATGYENFDITGNKDGMIFDFPTFELRFVADFDPPNGLVDLKDLAALINLMVSEGDATYTVTCPWSVN